jgi:hypothetical protein
MKDHDIRAALSGGLGRQGSRPRFLYNRLWRFPVKPPVGPRGRTGKVTTPPPSLARPPARELADHHQVPGRAAGTAPRVTRTVPERGPDQEPGIVTQAPPGPPT